MTQITETVSLEIEDLVRCVIKAAFRRYESFSCFSARGFYPARLFYSRFLKIVVEVKPVGRHLLKYCCWHKQGVIPLKYFALTNPFASVVFHRDHRTIIKLR